MGILHSLRACFTKYPKCKQLLDREVTTSGAYLADLDDPDHANAFAATAWEFGLLKVMIHSNSATQQAQTCNIYSDDETNHMSELTIELCLRPAIYQPWNQAYYTRLPLPCACHSPSGLRDCSGRVYQKYNVATMGRETLTGPLVWYGTTTRKWYACCLRNISEPSTIYIIVTNTKLKVL